ncbi:MAG TPA: hypothetical protein PK361_03065 [Chiayiivirga sp.]|nr:hypothetical protein [Chiayiivirga sp.]
MSKSEPTNPCFDFSETPSPVQLSEGRVRLVWRESEYLGTGKVLLRFLPTPRIVIDAAVSMPLDVSMPLAFGDLGDLALYLEGRQIEGFATRRSGENDILHLIWNPNVEPLEWGELQTGELAHVVSHLFNFPDFIGGCTPITKLPNARRQLVLRSSGWRIAIQSLSGKATKEALDRVREEGGSQLTHVVRLERDDGSLFTVEDVKSQILMLTEFLSLVKGSSIWAVCEVGFDANGDRVWGSWCAPRIGEPPYSWSDKLRGDQVEALFPQFVRRWTQSEAWRDCLTHAIYWYTQANTGTGQPGIDSALILVLAALERLSHHRMVVDRKMILSEGFKALKASDKLRMLLSDLGIPIDIQNLTPEIQNKAKQYKWVDRPHAITEIRNTLVHPDSKVQASECFFEAWKLSLWYLELSILALCGYQGSYRNRLSQGNREDVPWKA